MQLEKIKNRIQKLKKKRPAYKEILNFYLKLKTEQENIKSSLKIQPLQLRKDLKDLLSREGFPLLEKKDFPIDIDSSINLFQRLCKIGKATNLYMSKYVKRIEEAIEQKRINLEEIFLESPKEEKVDEILNESGIDKKIFLFFLKESAMPSIEEGLKSFLKEVNGEKWLKNFCPICGSPPFLALLKEEVGKRYLLCSYCGYEWRFDRLACPFCENREQEFLQYFYEEGEENYRIDTCEKCKQYIKTLDLRKMELIDPLLEDISTLHLDLLASKKGYNRPTPNPWSK